MTTKTKLQEVFPLSLMQEGMLFHAISSTDSDAYFEQVTFEIKGNFDVALFVECWEYLFERHGVLRSVFNYKHTKQPIQIVVRNRKMPLQQLDLRGQAPETQQAALEKFAAADRALGFDLTRDILMRMCLLQTGQASWYLVWSHHHILMDGWCTGILLKEFLAVYAAKRAGKTPNLRPPAPYASYIRWLKTQDKEKARNFWKTYVAKAEGMTGLPGQIATGYEEGLYDFQLSEAMSQALEAIGARYKVSLNTLLQCVWGLLLGRIHNTDHAIFGGVVSGRQVPVPGVEDMIGLFINTVPVVIPAPPELPFSELMVQVQQDALAAEKFHHFPLAEIQSLHGQPGELLDHIFVFENYPMDEAALEGAQLGFALEDIGVYERTNYNLNLLVSKTSVLNFKFRYNAAVYAQDQFVQLEQIFRYLFAQLIEAPEQQVGKLKITPPAEHAHILEDFNHTATSWPKDISLPDLIFARNQGRMDNIALEDAFGRLSYAELEQQSSAIARQLLDAGVLPGDKVALFFPPGLDLLTCVFGVLRAGGAYVPIDPAYPAERILFILSDSNSALVLSDVSGIAALSNIEVNNSLLPDPAYVSERPLPTVEQSANAYVIYTSGSTGRPKGCPATQRNVIRLAVNEHFQYDFDSSDIWILAHSICFDVSVWEIFTALSWGGKLVIPSREVVRDPEQFHQWIRDHKVTVLNQTPPAFYQFIQQEMRGTVATLSAHLRYVIFAGDRLECALLQDWARRYPPDKVKLINMYGITEVTVHTSFYQVTEGDIFAGNGTSRVGIPIPGTRIYVMDAQRQLMPIGMEGEYYVAGDGVLPGYLNRPELTSVRFLEDPFFPGERMYQSGDWGKWTAEGVLEVAGRRDDQVKIRGHRIETGEIATVLKSVPAIREAYVHVRSTQANGLEVKDLIAYYTVRSGHKASSEALKAHLSEQLPGYMVPAFMVELDAFPLTSNSKIDRRALPQPRAQRDPAAPAPTQNMTATEASLAKIWEQTIGLQGIHRDADFFALGGHSLHILQLVAAIEKGMGQSVPVNLIFQRPVLKDLASWLEEARHPGFQHIGDLCTQLSSGERGRVFLFPPAVGLSLAYLGISQSVADYAIHGFNFPEVAQPLIAYVRHIQQVQPTGPLVLLGFSAGGSFAFQVAQILEESGREVKAIVLMDCGRRLQHFPISEAEIDGIVSQYISHPLVHELGLTPGLKAQYAQRIRRSAEYVTRDAPLDLGRVKAALYLVKSDETKDDPSLEAGWQDAGGGPVQVFQGTGPHSEMIFPPYLASNAALLRDILDQIHQV